MATKAPSLTPWAQALSVATKSVTAPSSAGTTTNSQTGQVFQNATTWPYTKSNAENVGWSTSVTPTPVSPSTAQNFAPNTLGAFVQANNWNLQAGQQAFQGFRKANYTPTPILPIAQRTNLTPNATGGNMGEVKPLGGMTWSAKTGITPLKQENFGQSTKQITSTLGATKDDQDFLNNAFTKFTPAQQAEWNAMSQQNKLDSSKALLQGYRDTRDATIAKENLDYNHDLTVNAKTEQFKADVEQAQRNIANTNHNMALVTGMSWPLRSSDVASGTSNAIANAQATYNNLVRSNDYEMAQLANNYQVATKSLLNQYNDRVSTTTQKLLSNISALDATGEFGTKLGLLKGQDLIDQALNDNLNSQQFLADRMNMMSKIALEQQTMALAQAKMDDAVTKTINDGFAYNSNWIRLKNAQGQPIKAQIQMSDQEKLDAQYANAVKLKQMEIDQQNNTPRIIGTDEYGVPVYGTVNGGTYKPGVVTTGVTPKSTEFLNLPIGAKWWSCGFYANRWVGLSWEPGGDDSIQGRIKTYTDTAPVKGGLALFYWAGYDAKNGHVAIIKSLNSDGTMTVRDSNVKWDETVQERTMSVNQAKGFYNNTPLAQSYAQGTGVPDKERTSQYIQFMEKGTLPAGMKDNSRKADEFRSEATQGYTDAKNQQLMESNFKITNPQAFIATSAKQKEDISNAIKQVAPFITGMDDLIKLVKENGTENPYSETGRKMTASAKNLQLIAKEIYNLGVLNWPDLSLMEAIIANPTDMTANTIGSFQNYETLLKDAKKTILKNVVSQAKWAGLEYTKLIDDPIEKAKANAPVDQARVDKIKALIANQ